MKELIEGVQRTSVFTACVCVGECGREIVIMREGEREAKREGGKERGRQREREAKREGSKERGRQREREAKR